MLSTKSSRRLHGLVFLVVVVLTTGCVAAIGNRSSPPKTTPEQTPGESQGAYRIETIRLDDGGWALLKYRPDTGEAWYSAAPHNDVWIPIHDTVSVPGSRYVFEPRTTGGPGWTIIRLDTISGRTWVTRDSVWIEIADSPDTTS